ncbi:ATP-binding cassette domain-containing protein [Paraconexibacter sp.]|uniref:ATP-binding cassette domain-containing protein n=1 Tax=Paraconexibacter sp. TaxID=2949640 RepID=UPI003561A32F
MVAHGIVRRRGARTILDGIDLRVGASSRLAVIGPNGAGKSTLLRILAGTEPPDAGRVVREGSVGLFTGLEPRSAVRGAAQLSLADVLLERVGVAGAQRRVDALAARLADGDLSAIEPHAEALEVWLALGGADAVVRLEVAADRLGLDRDLLQRPVSSLSGGQRARAGLVGLVAARHDSLLLDEPTTHLDDAGLEVLASVIDDHPSGLVVVSHDRTLLAEVADEVLVLDPRTGRGEVHAGGFAAMEAAREAARARAQAAHDDALRRRRKLRQAEMQTRQRAQGTIAAVRNRPRDNDKSQRRFFEMRAQQRQSRARKIGDRAQRIEVPDAPWQAPTLRLGLDGGDGRGGRGRGGGGVVGGGPVLALTAGVLQRGSWRLGPLDLSVRLGERVELRGPNASGKSTVLAALAGALPLAAGERWQAANVRVAVLGQDRDGLSEDRPLAAAVAELAGVEDQVARAALGAFGLGADHADRSAATLSSGERTRAELAVIGALGAGVLLLDEPSNNLDVESLEVLEAALAGWGGAVVVATHDVRLRERLEVGRTVRL